MLTGLGPRNPYTRYLLLADEGEPGSEGGAGGGGAPPPPAAVTFTAEQQAEINRLIGAEKAKATRAGATATKAEIEAFLAEEKAKADRESLEGEARLQAELDAANARAAQAEATAARTSAEARAQAALLSVGMPAGNVADGLLLVGVDPADDVDALAAKVDALKTRLPALFAAADWTPPGFPPPPPGITPPAVPAGTGTPLTGLDQGAAIARQRYPKPTAA